jgi:branched-chain amino acid transport system ATP-binding protein
MATILELRRVRAFYGATPALHGIDLELEEGGITAVLGANGAGKSTTLRAICGMIRTEGSIAFQGRPIHGRSTEEIVRLGIAHVPENRGTFVDLTTEENLLLGGYTRIGKAAVLHAMRDIYRLFPRLEERRAQQAGTLSGGEQQMLAIGRALMLSPRLMLLDEPSFGLAPLMVQEIYRVLRRIGREEGVSILLVEQNATLALDLSDRAYLLESGAVVTSGASHALAADESIRRSYLGY